jgi:hypothetical protein
VSTPQTRQGECLCGRVRYEITLPLVHMGYCHCSMCRKHYGAAFATAAFVTPDAFRWISGEESLGRYRSSDALTRAFCTTCGSVAPMPVGDLIECPAGNLQGDLGMTPREHIFVGSKAPWYTITDDLPQHEGYPPVFGGGPGVKRPQPAPRPGVTEGSCLCGDVAWEVANPRGIMFCHCTRCRRARSTAHGANLFAPLDGFRWLRGESQLAEYKVPEARAFKQVFCTRCGSPAPRLAPERGFVVIPAGALDWDPGVKPLAHIYVAYKASWFEVTGPVPQYPELPPSF